MHMRKFQSLHWPSPVVQWLEQLTCYQKVPDLNPIGVITFPWFCHLCLIPGITPVVLRMCKRWQHLAICAEPMRSWNLQLGKKVKINGVWLICPFGKCPITSWKLVGQTEEFCRIRNVKSLFETQRMQSMVWVEVSTGAGNSSLSSHKYFLT